MTIWESEWGDRFESEEEAREDAYEHMDPSSYQERLSYTITYNELLEWASQHDGFWNDFSEQIQDAENEFFFDYYTKIEEED